MDAASKDSRLQPGRDGGVLMQRMVRHRSYDEACRDATATPAERENALLAEYALAVRQIEWLWAACKIVYWPKDGSYPIEHNPHARKYSRDTIEAQMPNEQRSATAGKRASSAKETQ